MQSPPSITIDSYTGAKKPRKKLGVLQRVPTVAPSNEHLSSALKRASKVGLLQHGQGVWVWLELRMQAARCDGLNKGQDEG